MNTLNVTRNILEFSLSSIIFISVQKFGNKEFPDDFLKREYFYTETVSYHVQFPGVLKYLKKSPDTIFCAISEKNTLSRKNSKFSMEISIIISVSDLFYFI